MRQYHTFDRFTAHSANDAEAVAVPVAADILGVASKAVQHMARSDYPPCVRIGGCALPRHDVPDHCTMTRAAVSSALGHSTHQHLPWDLLSSQKPPAAGSWRDSAATSRVDAGCVPATLGDPCLTASLAEKMPALFAGNRTVDRRNFRDRRATFTARTVAWSEAEK